MNSVVGGVFLWVALPIVAFLIMFTVVGLLLGLTVLLFVLPIMWVLGYIVAGARLGLAITGRMGREPSGKTVARCRTGSVHPAARCDHPVPGLDHCGDCGVLGRGSPVLHGVRGGGWSKLPGSHRLAIGPTIAAPQT